MRTIGPARMDRTTAGFAFRAQCGQGCPRSSSPLKRALLLVFIVNPRSGLGYCQSSADGDCPPVNAGGTNISLTVMAHPLAQVFLTSRSLRTNDARASEYSAQVKYVMRLTYDPYKHSVLANRVQLTLSQAP